MKKLFLISLLIGNVAFAKGSFVKGALVGGTAGYLIGASRGNGSSTTHNYSQLNVYECNCGDVKCVITETKILYRSVTKYGKCAKNTTNGFLKNTNGFLKLYSKDQWPIFCYDGEVKHYFKTMPYKEVVLVEFPPNTAQIIYKQDPSKPFGCELIK